MIIYDMIQKGDRLLLSSLIITHSSFNEVYICEEHYLGRQVFWGLVTVTAFLAVAELTYSVEVNGKCVLCCLRKAGWSGLTGQYDGDENLFV